MQPTGSRNNSLTTGDGAELEVTRQFLTTNKKVINRGDSFRRREGSAPRVGGARVEIVVDRAESHHRTAPAQHYR